MPRYFHSLLLPLVAAAVAATPLGAQRVITINQTRLTEARIREVERQWQTSIPEGRYWYDRMSGAWGTEGGPTTGFIHPGLDLGGPLRPDASRGNSGVFINGRELPVQDVTGLGQIVTVLPGRWWVDGQGYFGAEGGPALGNLRLLAPQRQGTQPGTVSANDGRDLLGTDSNGCHYFNSRDYGSSNTTSWASPGC